MNPEGIGGYSDRINQLVETLIHDPRAIVGFAVLIVVSMFLKWKWFYIPALTLVALVVTYHYTFARAGVGEFSPNLGFFLVGIFLVVVVGVYFLLIKD